MSGLATAKILQLVLLLLLLPTLTLSALTNTYTEWFYAADILPFTLVLLSYLLLLPLSLPVFLSAPPPPVPSYPFALAPSQSRSSIEGNGSGAGGRIKINPHQTRTLALGAYTLLAILWLPTAAFASNKWAGIPPSCPGMPWCAQIAALRVFVWVLWVALLTAALTTYRTRPPSDLEFDFADKRITQTDYFART